MQISIILGTRPEIIKMAPIIREAERLKLNFFILHTGQHYSYNMDRVFFEQLRLPNPNYNLDVGSGSHAEQTGRMLVGIEKVLQERRPDIVLVEGDTNTVLAGALAAIKLHVPVGHVEAGLRSYDRGMPEEINRILADHCSHLLFAPTQKAQKTLLCEGIPRKKIFVTGNTIVDAVYQNLALSKSHRDTVDDLNLDKDRYFLATIHRQENIDDERRFRGILKGLKAVHSRFKLPVIYPIHPRAKKRLKTLALNPHPITVIEPLDYLGFLQLETNARLILTDSGGVQEEACVLRVPCVTLRDNTERPETLEVGSNTLAGTNPKIILKKTKLMLSRTRRWRNPFGNGKAGQRIVRTLTRSLQA